MRALAPRVRIEQACPALTVFFRATSTQSQAYHRAEDRLGRPRRALNTTWNDCTSVQRHGNMHTFWLTTHVWTLAKKPAFRRKRARRNLPQSPAPSNWAVWPRPPRSCATLAAMTPRKLLHSRLQATRSDREEEGVIDRRANDEPDDALAVGGGRDRAEDRCSAKAAHERGTRRASDG